MEKDIYWNKIVIHGISIQPFSIDEGLEMLKNEIEIFNPQLKLMKKPAWLYFKENRQLKMHAFIIITIENANQAYYTLHHKLYVVGLWLKTQKYENSTEKTYCQNC